MLVSLSFAILVRIVQCVSSSEIGQDCLKNIIPRYITMIYAFITTYQSDQFERIKHCAILIRHRQYLFYMVLMQGLQLSVNFKLFYNGLIINLLRSLD